MAEPIKVPSAVAISGPPPPLLGMERQPLKLCLSSKAKPGSWTVSPPKIKTDLQVSEASDVRWNQDHPTGNNDTKQSGNKTSLETSPCLPPYKLNLSQLRACTSPSSKNSDEGQVSTESEDDQDYYDHEEMNAVVTSVDHSGTSPRIRIGMSPRAGRYSPRSSGGFSPRLAGSLSPRVSSRGLSPHATRFARVSASSPTSVKIVFLKNEQNDDTPEVPEGLKSPFKKPIGAASPRAPIPPVIISNLSTEPKTNGHRIERNDTKPLKEYKLEPVEDAETKDPITKEPRVKPIKICQTEISQIKRVERGSLSRSESGDSDDLPRLEKVVDVKRSKRSKTETESGDDAFGDYDEMPDDLSRHSSVDRYSEPNNTGTPVYDSHSMSSTSPPLLDRMSSGETEGPPPLAKMCCSGSQCHKSLGALGLHCLGSPKDISVSPQYLECGGAREEAASIGEGSPPSDVEHANKVTDMPQFMLCNGSPQIPSPGDQEGCRKPQTVTEPERCDSRPPAAIPSPQQPPLTATPSPEQPPPIATPSPEQPPPIATPSPEQPPPIATPSTERPPPTTTPSTKPTLPTATPSQQKALSVSVSGVASGATATKSSFLDEFAKFVASAAVKDSPVADSPVAINSAVDEVPQSCKDNQSVSINAEHLVESKTSDELTADDTESVDDKYNLRPKKRKAEHSACECCSHLPCPKKVKPINVRRFEDQVQKVFQLRHRVCVMFQTVFPELQYPERFRQDTKVVEDLMDQVIEAAKQNEDCPSPDSTQSYGSVNWDPQVLLCKSPRKCLLALRHKICRMLLAVLPTLQLEDDFDRGSRSVDRLLDDVIYLNTNNR